MEALPGPSNPNLVKFVDYFLCADFYKKEEEVLKQYLSKPEEANRELERKRRVGELIAIIWAYYEDIKHLIVNGIKIIPYDNPSSSSNSEPSKIKFKSCIPTQLCVQVQVTYEPDDGLENRSETSSPSPNRRNMTDTSWNRSLSNRRPEANFSVPSVFVQMNFAGDYPSSSSNATVDIVQAFHLSEAKVSLLRQIARRYVEINSGKELIYGLIWEVKYNLGMLATLSDDHIIFNGDEKEGADMLLQLGGPNYLTALSSGLTEALKLKQAKMQRYKPKQQELATVDDAGSVNLSKQTIRKLPIKMLDLINGRVLTEESGRKLLSTLKTFTFTSKRPNSVELTVSLHDPQSETFVYTLSKCQFVCQLTNYLAYCDSPQRRFRLTTIQFDLSHVAKRTHIESWPSIAAHLEERLGLIFSGQAIDHFLEQTANFSNLSIVEQLSKYEYFDVKFEGQNRDFFAFDNAKDEFTQITFTIVKEAFHESELEGEDSQSKFTFTLSDLKKAYTLGSLRLSDDRKHMYTSRLLTTLDHLHKSQFFYGEFSPDKIFFAQDGSIKLFDPYLDTLASVFIPFVFEKEIEITKNAVRICKQPDFEEYFVKLMFNNDVFNFGSFVLSIVTDFHFEPVMLVASGIDLDKSNVSKLLLKKLSSQVTKESLIDFINMCINPSEYQRTELSTLLHHSFVLEWNARVVKEIALQPPKDDLDTNLYELGMLGANGQEQLDKEKDTSANASNLLEQISKYTRSAIEFKELYLLGKGGFGSVVKVKNLLDDYYYALKRVIIEEDDIDKLRREVQHLSRLSHPNVIRYFAAWTETYSGQWEYLQEKKEVKSKTDEQKDDDSSDDESDEEEEEEKSKDKVNQLRNKFDLLKVDEEEDEETENVKRDSDSDDDSWAEKSDEDDSDDEESNDETTDNNRKSSAESYGYFIEQSQKTVATRYDNDLSCGLEIEFAHSQGGDENGHEEESVNEVTLKVPKQKKKILPSKFKSEVGMPRYCLCIQMELCDMETLQEQIAKKKFLNNPEYKARVLGEILSALDYIHKMGIIHRDLKPKNILFDKKMRVKIGDFGLALAVSNKPSDTEADRQDSMAQLEVLNNSNSKSNKRNTADSHSVGIGTALYMAPEIYFDAHYTSLVDMFSLGVIIVEMCYPMETQSERVRVLSALKPLKTQDISIATYKQMVNNFEPSFPKDIDKFVKAGELKLIKLLLDVSPKNRPSAESLLKKGVFGVIATDQKNANENLLEMEMLSQLKKKQIKSVIEDTGSPNYHFLLRSLFSKNHSVLDTTLFDFNGTNESSESFYTSVFQFNLTNRVFETLSRQFGALHLQSMPFLLPKGALCQSAKETLDSCPLLNSDGFIVSLPTNIRTQLARYFALSGNSVQFLTRSTMERVFYKQHLGPYHPKEFWTSSFDLIWPQSYSKATAVPYAELLTFSTQILSFFLPLPLSNSFESIDAQSCISTRNNYTLVFNLTNLSIFQAICNYMRISNSEYQTIINLLADNQDNIFKKSFNEFRLSLKMELVKQAKSEASFELLCKILAIFADSPNDLLNQIRTQLCLSYKIQVVNQFLRTKVEPLIDEMSMVHRLWSATTAKSPICPQAIKFRFGLSIVSPTTFYYNHILLHATLEQQSRIISVVAIGGRYDLMINGYMSLYEKAEKDISQKEFKKKVEVNKPDDDFWPSWKANKEKKSPVNNSSEDSSTNLSLDSSDRPLESKKITSFQAQPFQPKHALGISFSVDKLSRYFSISSETELIVSNKKFQEFFPFLQQPLGLHTPSLIDLLIVPSSAVVVCSRLAQHFRSCGLRVTVLPELGPREDYPTLSKFSEDEPRLEAVNKYACHMQIRLVLLVDHFAKASIGYDSSTTTFVIREYVYGIAFNGQPITAANLRQSASNAEYVSLGDGQWKVVNLGDSEAATVNYVIAACGLDESLLNTATPASSSGYERQDRSSNSLINNFSSLRSTPPSDYEYMSSSAEPSGRTNRSSSFSIKPGSMAIGSGSSTCGQLPSTSPNTYSSVVSSFSNAANTQTSYPSSVSNNFEIDFICANKSTDRRRLSTSILSFVNNKLPTLVSSSSPIRVLAIDVPYTIVKAIADLVDSDLHSDFVQNVPGASALFECSSSSSSLSPAETHSVLENLKNYFFFRFKELLSRHKRDFSDFIEKTINEMWDSIQKRLRQSHGGKGLLNFIFVLLAYKDGNLKYRLVSF